MTEADRPPETPFDQFAAWLAEATTTEPNDPEAMTLATCADGRPSTRMVLLKGVDAPGSPDRGLVFYTNLQSRKAGELAANPQAALLFHWKTLRRQVRVEGVVQPATQAEADAYFASRHPISRLGAWASDQSRPLDARATLEARLAAVERQFADGNIPRPPHWGGFRVVPDYFEFWQDMPHRLHDRTIYQRRPDGWATGKLYP